MSIPNRNASARDVTRPARTFFATTKTIAGRARLQSERNAALLVDVLRSYMAAGKFRVHDFVIMPDHVHMLLTGSAGMTIEKAMQLIKGGFSYRLNRECGYRGEVWQLGFSESRVEDAGNFQRYREYIGGNPVRAGLADSEEEYPYRFAYLAKQKAAAKASAAMWMTGTTQVVP